MRTESNELGLNSKATFRYCRQLLLAISVAIIALIGLSTHLLHAGQPPIFSWSQVGQSNSAPVSGIGYRVCNDTNGNSYFYGTSGGCTLGGLPIGAGAYIAKCDSKNNVIWVRLVPSGLWESLQVDSSGNCFLAGTFQGTLDFNSTQLNYPYGVSMFVSKYDSNGNLNWAYRVGGATNNYNLLSLAIDNSGNLFLAGNFPGTLNIGNRNLNPAGAANDLFDIFLSKFDSSGNFQWAENLGITNAGGTVKCAADSKGNALLVSSFGGYWQFGTSNLVSGSSGDTFIAKFDGNGAPLWVNQLKGNSYPSGVCADNIGNGYIVGIAFGGVSNSVASTQGGDLFVSKYSPSGAFTWLAQANPTNGQNQFFEVLGVTADAGGNVFVTGDFDYQFNFGTTTVIDPAQSGNDIPLMAEFTQDGLPLWARRVGLGGFGYGISTDQSQRLLITGYFYGTADFDGVSYSSVQNDLFMGSLAIDPPIINSQPADQVLRAGSSTTLSVSATGRSPLTYQWYSGALAITGATNSSFSVSNLQYSADYKVLVFDPGSYVESRDAKVEALYLIGDEIKPPLGAVLTNSSVLAGPSVTGSGKTCWIPDVVAGGHCYAQGPGDIIITWKDAATNDIVVMATIQGPPAQQFVLGQEIPAPANASTLIAPTSNIPGAIFWHQASQKLYATGVASNYNITWPSGTCGGITMAAQNNWPKNENQFQACLLNTPATPLRNWGLGTTVSLAYQDDGVGVDAGGLASGLFSASSPGRSLLILSPGNPQTTNIYFQFVSTLAWNDPVHYTNGVATIGQEVTNTLGFHDWSLGSPYVLNPLSRYCSVTNYYNRTIRSGPIIPVNQDDPNTTADDFVLICYQAGTLLVDPLTGRRVNTIIAWPHESVQYDCQWPTNAETIVISSEIGSGPIDPNRYQNWAIYNQSDPTQPGFNPNDEHALIGSTSNGPAIFALRDDLGTPTTSQPYVLMTYQDGRQGNKPGIRVFKVVSGTLNYSGQAGDLVQPPYPLSTLQICKESYGYSGPYWEDRNLNFWAQAAGDDGGPTNITMRYWYPLQPGFYFPSNYFVNFPSGVVPTNLPPAGTHFPWLDLRGGAPGTPINVNYTVTWPLNVPQLTINETLTKPKFGLPDISQQNSVETIYQQSLATGHGLSVQLIDPTALRQVPLAQLPNDLTPADNGGNKYFPILPPQLRDRLYYDPINHQLVFIGQFVPQFGSQEPAGYLLLNAITSREKAVLQGVSKDANWIAAINALSTNQIIQVRPNVPFNHPLALSAGGAQGQGYVTLAFNNATNLAMDQPSDPISLAIIRVGPELYRGQLEVIESDNPFDEKLTLRHSGDFAGQADGLIFEWRTLPPGNDGLPQTSVPQTNWNLYIPNPPSGQGAVDITIEGPGLFTLSDNFFICRYRSTNVLSAAGTSWSAWTDPGSGFAPGWISRVLQNITPFEERFNSYQNSTNNTIVSMIAQAGPPYQGVAPLNAQAADSFGLIQIYQTVLQRGMSFSIDGAPPIDYGPANDALLQAASRLSDLYMLLGNEAYAEASDPTIPTSGAGGSLDYAPSIYCFEDQMASRLEEELALLRGRDDSVLPSVQNSPVYNRLQWNFTGGNGEVAYANKFGVATLGDAQQQYPMGHGDAWGHYLSALKVYYGLLHNPNFTWVPRIETVLVGGIGVSVNYQDERKFAKAAAAKARSGADIVSLTYRDNYTNPPTLQYQGYFDANTNRAWGLSEWGTRAGQGALFDWVVANAVLPPVSANTGIQKVDRTTVSELGDIAGAYQSIQNEVDKADAGLNPLGLAQNVIPFDIEPSQTTGTTHFEQIYSRAVAAINNALALFNFAQSASQALRTQADTVQQFNNTVANKEADFNSRLIETFGYPYPDDIGAGGAYPQGYQGPDLYHYMYYNPATVLGIQAPPAITFVVTNADVEPNPDGSLMTNWIPVTYTLSTNGFGMPVPAGWTRDRQAPGQIQSAQSDLWQAKARFDKSLEDYDNLINQIEDQANLLQSQYNINAQIISIQDSTLNTQESFDSKLLTLRATELAFRNTASYITLAASASAESLPSVTGVIGGLADGVIADFTAPARGSINLLAAVSSQVMNSVADVTSLAEMDQQQAQQLAQSESSIDISILNQQQAVEQQRLQLRQLIRQEAPARLELYTLQEALQQTTGKYASTLAQGQLILQDRLRFRQQTATQVEQYRYKDMAFRIFQNDALQKYRAQFDMAALYVYLAAAAYDYETVLAPGDPNGPGSTFMTSIVKARSIGQISNGQPIAGSGANGDDPGLASPMAKMSQNYEVLKTQFGLDNPDQQTAQFSLRSQAFRILPGYAGNDQWRNRLSTLVVSNILAIPEFQRYCIPPSPLLPVEPGIVIPFSTTVSFGENFFGWPISGGDSAYDSSHFATKIRSEGVWFSGYNGLAMSPTPYVYLIPVGNDVLRVPGGNGATREWKILEQLLPVPYPANPSTPNWIPINDTLGDQFYAVRRYPSLLAYNDGGTFNASQVTSSSRLIGRSVWNTEWLLIIPAGTLLSDRNEAIQRFVNGSLLTNGQRDGNGVTDIKIYFQSASYPGY